MNGTFSKILIIGIIIIINTSNMIFDNNDSVNTIIQDENHQLNSTNSMISKQSIKSTFLYFTKNLGQIENTDFRFYSQDGSIWFTNDSVWFKLKRELKKEHSTSQNYFELDPYLDHIDRTEFEYLAVRQIFINSNRIEPMGRIKKSWFNNYFYGNDSSKWICNVPNYMEICYENLYNGIDLKYYYGKHGIKYDFIINPGADISQIKLKYEGIKGLSLDNNGDLVIHNKLIDIVEEKPFIYQKSLKNITTTNIAGRFILYDESTYGFEIIGDYNSKDILVIDPLIDLGYSTFINGENWDEGYNIVTDSNRNAYTTGEALSTKFPTTPGAYDRTINGETDTFILKLNPDGSELVYSTFIGGSVDDRGRDIFVDKFGNAFITGYITSSNFPTTNGVYDRTYNGGSFGDVFVLKINNLGSSLLFSTFIGGKYSDFGLSILVDEKDRSYITGWTTSTDFPTTNNAFDKVHDGVWFDVIFIILNQSGTDLLYSTFFGGSNGEIGYDQVFDNYGNIFITGFTGSSNFPTTPGANDTTHNSLNDIFVIKFDTKNLTLVYSTYIGGSKSDHGYGITLDEVGNAYITGWTNSLDFPVTPNASDKTFNGGDRDSIICKLNYNGSVLEYASYIGGIEEDYAVGVVYDTKDSIFIVGNTNSKDFPVTDNAYKNTSNGYYNFFIVKYNKNDLTIIFSSYFGGSVSEECYAITMDLFHDIYITGWSGSYNYPVTSNAFDEYQDTGRHMVVTKLIANKTICLRSVELLFEGNNTNLIYSEYYYYSFKVNINDSASLVQLKDVFLILDPEGINVILHWCRVTGNFTVLNDPYNYIILNATSKVWNDKINKWTIFFNITINWTYPDENFHDIQCYVLSKDLPRKWLNISHLYRVENDLIFLGTLSVKNEKNQVLEDYSLVRGGETLFWSGLKVVYENTSNIYPPDREYDIILEDESKKVFTDSPTTGENFNIISIANTGTNKVGVSNKIFISGIPRNCDKTNCSFIYLIDGDNVTFINSTPDNKTWQTTNNIETGIEIFDTGGGLVKGSSVAYSISLDNRSNWTPWQTIDNLNDGQIINVHKTLKFDDGVDNYIKWRAADTLGNGPVESQDFSILVDTESVTFSNPKPGHNEISSTADVEVSIVISDDFSGVNTSSIKYSISNNYGLSWTPWRDVTFYEYKNDNSIIAKTNFIFENGTKNMVRWQAYDLAGNGPEYSGYYSVKINVPKQPPIPDVQLISPLNNSFLFNGSIYLTWELINKSIENAKFDILLDIDYPPKSSIERNYDDNSIHVQELEYNVIYYWTVIPVCNGIFGTCLSGIWSFKIELLLPKANLSRPANNSVISSIRPTLVWSVEYNGTEPVTFDLYFGQDNDPNLTCSKLDVTYYSVQMFLEDNTTYYWKIIPRVGKYQGIASETWSFTLKTIQIRKFDLEIVLSKEDVELQPGNLTIIKGYLTNLGNENDNFGLSVSSLNSTEISVELSNTTIDNVRPTQIIDFEIIINVPVTQSEGEFYFKINAQSKNAHKAGLDINKTINLRIRIKEVDFQTENGESPEIKNNNWIFYLGLIILLILIIIILFFYFNRKLAKNN